MGPDFRNFFERSLEYFFSEEKIRIFETSFKMSLEEFGKICQRRFQDRMHVFKTSLETSLDKFRKICKKTTNLVLCEESCVIK